MEGAEGAEALIAGVVLVWTRAGPELSAAGDAVLGSATFASDFFVSDLMVFGMDVGLSRRL